MFLGHFLRSGAVLAGVGLVSQPAVGYALLSIDGVDVPADTRIISFKIDLARVTRQTVAVCHLPMRWVLTVSNVVGGPAYIIAKTPDAAAAVPAIGSPSFGRSS